MCKMLVYMLKRHHAGPSTCNVLPHKLIPSHPLKPTLAFPRLDARLFIYLFIILMITQFEIFYFVLWGIRVEASHNQEMRLILVFVSSEANIVFDI